jgi:hypothetical protein
VRGFHEKTGGREVRAKSAAALAGAATGALPGGLILKAKAVLQWS